MYSKEQVAMRLKLGSTLSINELILVVKSMLEDIEKLNEKIKELEGNTNNELSKNTRGINPNSGETIQTSTIRSSFKL